MSTPNHTPIQNIAIDNGSIAAVVFRTYARLVSLAWKHDWKFTDWLTQTDMERLIGLDWSNIKRHTAELKGIGWIDWATDGKKRRRFFIVELRLPEGAKAQLCAPSSSGIDTDTFADIEPPLPPAKAQKCALSLILDQDAYNALRAAHICEPATTELANLPHVTADYVRAQAAQAKRDGVKIGALIHRIRQGWPAPIICEKCGGLDGDHTRDCPTRPARPAGDLTEFDRAKLTDTQPAPESPADAIWRQVLDDLHLQLTSAVFNTWLQHTTVISADDGTYIIGVQNESAQDWLDHRLRPMIERTLSGVVGHDAHVRFVLKEEQHESVEPN